MKTSAILTLLAYLQCIGHSSAISKVNLRRSVVSSDFTIGTFVISDIQPEQHSENEDFHQKWNIELPNGFIHEIINIDPTWKAENARVLKSGLSQLKIPMGRIINEKLDLGGGKPEFVGEKSKGKGARNLAVVGDMSVLVVRVVANDGATTFNETQLSDAVFGNGNDPVNLKSQYEACSYNKVSITKPATVPSGATTVTVAVSTTQGDDIMVNAITAELNSMYGVSNPSYIADHVMYCLPSATMAGIAYGYINHWNTVFNNEWCTYVSAQMHEIGHNLNLAHSHESPVAYGDQTGMMGYSYGYSDLPVMCFNAAKSWQLGWYSDRQLTFTTTDTTWSGNLIGIADYGTTTSLDGPVLVKLNTDTDVDIYVSFNRRAGVNAETQEAGDQVTVVQTGQEGLSYSESNLDAKLNTGGSITVENFSGTGKDLTLTVNNIVLTTPYSYASITIELADKSCTVDSDCAFLDQDACNIGACGADNLCALQSVDNCCLTDFECADQDACNVGSCGVDNTCALVPVANCCLLDSECPNENACSVGLCGVDNTCTVAPVAGCCLDDSDCPDENACSVGTCGVDNTCGFEAVANCCLDDSECAGLTQDACNVGSCGVDNTCAVVPVENCCLADSDCPDENACSVGTCGVDNTCGFAPLESCCLMDSDCADQDACNVGSCGVDNTCAVVPVANCCLLDSDCPDENACSVGSCGIDNTCTLTPVQNCCLVDSECDDGDMCTFDSCNPVSHTCDNVVDSQCTCGNGVCDAGEDCVNCPGDCISGVTPAAFCGNGVCEGGNGESTTNCPSDCQGVTTGKPSGRYCCGAGCGCSDPRCGIDCTETAVVSEAFCCGDDVCTGSEDAGNCAIDCL